MSEEFYIQLARDYFGAAARDNSRAELIELGRAIDSGEIGEG